MEKAYPEKDWKTVGIRQKEIFNRFMKKQFSAKTAVLYFTH